MIHEHVTHYIGVQAPRAYIIYRACPKQIHYNGLLFTLSLCEYLNRPFKTVKNFWTVYFIEFNYRPRPIVKQI